MPGTYVVKDRSLAIVPREELRESIQLYHRDAFGDVLAELLDCRPERQVMYDMAQTYPLRWGHLVKIFAMLAGYTEKTESIQRSISYHLHQMSDAELLTELQKSLRTDPSLLTLLKDSNPPSAPQGEVPPDRS